MLSSILWNVRCVGTKLGRAVNVFRKPPPTHLPQKDNDLGKRRKGLDHAKKIYQLDQKDFGFVKTGEGTKEVDLVNIPPMLKTVPCKETYYFYDLRFAAKFLFYQIYESLQGEGSWTLDEIISHFRHSRILTKPKNNEV
ncbi:uncharacterized protein LOC134247498 [Saccostrea cucullata]|uniref:uncharacterized protein LOC134247498 n=1 Tax=Saccostrea cuccullata TaxID=36930 RepID=UPI002ED44C4D